MKETEPEDVTTREPNGEDPKTIAEMMRRACGRPGLRRSQRLVIMAGGATACGGETLLRTGLAVTVPANTCLLVAITEQ